MAVIEINCDASWHEPYAPIGKQTVSQITVGYMAKSTFVGAFRFPLGALPSGSTVTLVELIVNVFLAGGASALWDIHPYNSDGQRNPCDDDFYTFFDRCSAGAEYVDDTTQFRTLGVKTLNLGAQACSDVEAAKTAVNRFSLGFHEEGGNDDSCILDGSGGTVAKLRITYTPPPPAAFGGSPIPQLAVARAILGVLA